VCAYSAYIQKQTVHSIRVTREGGLGRVGSRLRPSNNQHTTHVNTGLPSVFTERFYTLCGIELISFKKNIYIYIYTNVVRRRETQINSADVFVKRVFSHDVKIIIANVDAVRGEKKPLIGQRIGCKAKKKKCTISRKKFLNDFPRVHPARRVCNSVKEERRRAEEDFQGKTKTHTYSYLVFFRRHRTHTCVHTRRKSRTADTG